MFFSAQKLNKQKGIGIGLIYFSTQNNKIVTSVENCKMQGPSEEVPRSTYIYIEMQ